MVAFAKPQFELNARQQDGASLRDHLNVAFNATGIKPEQLDVPELPESVAYIWGWFCDLNRTRTSNGYGANCLTYTEIKDWMYVTDIHLEPFELRAIMAIDVEYMNQSAKEASKKEK